MKILKTQILETSLKYKRQCVAVVEKSEPLHTVSGHVKLWGHYGKQYGGPPKD